MKVVELRRRDGDGSVEVLARISAPDPNGPAVIEPTENASQAMVEGLLSMAGVVSREGATVSPADGAAYIRALTSSLRGSRLWAEEVAEGSEAGD